MKLPIIILLLCSQLGATCLTNNSADNRYTTSAISWFSGTAQSWSIGSFQNTATGANFDANGNLGAAEVESGNAPMAVQANTTACGGGAFCGLHEQGAGTNIFTSTDLGIGTADFSVTHPSFVFWMVRKDSAADTYQAFHKVTNVAAFTTETAASYTTEHTGGTDAASWWFASYRAARVSHAFIYKGVLPTTVALQMSHGIWPHDSSTLMVSPCENGTTAGFLSYNQGATISETGTITDGGTPPGITYPYVYTQ